MTATRDRKPAVRTLNMLGATRDGRQALLRIIVGGKTADCHATRAAGGWLVGPAELPDTATHTVGDDGSCTCPAGRHGKPGKHVAAVGKLIALRVLAKWRRGPWGRRHIGP